MYDIHRELFLIDGNTVKIEVCAGNTIKEVKEKIVATVGVEIEQQFLFYMNTKNELKEDNKKLAAHGILKANYADKRIQLRVPMYVHCMYLSL